MKITFGKSTKVSSSVRYVQVRFNNFPVGKIIGLEGYDSLGRRYVGWWYKGRRSYKLRQIKLHIIENFNNLNKGI